MLRVEPMREVSDQLNLRLLKWLKWEKGLYNMAATSPLKQQYAVTPDLFQYWKLSQP